MAQATAYRQVVRLSNNRGRPASRMHRRWHDREMAPRVTALDHVQLAMPPGREQEAEAFYCGVLGFEVEAKPPVLAARGGRWFKSGSVRVHLGVEDGFRPARKAHPGLRVVGWDELLAALDRHGLSWRLDEELPGERRAYVDDPFGNRLELIDDGTGPHRAPDPC